MKSSGKALHHPTIVKPIPRAEVVVLGHMVIFAGPCALAVGSLDCYSSSIFIDLIRVLTVVGIHWIIMAEAVELCIDHKACKALMP